MFETSVKLGQLCTSLALILAFYAFATATIATLRGNISILTSARNALYANFALLSFGGYTLIEAFVTFDFSVAYVAQNSNLDLPLLYRVSALWGGHEGSLFLWAWLLAGISALALWLHWRDYPLSMPVVIATLAAVQIGFLVFIIVLSNPFLSISPVPLNGRDLNPLLQDPGLAFHPPVLYLGYVAFVVPFAFAIAALIRGSTGAEWVTAVRVWTLFAWTSLTGGIMFGGYWAYYELGWGGYWAWDPVENASLMPWLTGTALVHSMMVQEKRKMFRIWNVFLVVTTFLLTLLGTFLVRSGVLTSVHAFAVDPGRGSFMLGFLAVAMVVGYGLVIWRAPLLDKDETIDMIESPLSREAGILANNVLLLLVTGIVLIGTLFPLIAEVFADEKISVGAPYYNKVILPIMVALIFLLAMGPSIPWRGMGVARLRRQYWKPAVAGVLLAVVAWALADVARPLTIVSIAVVGFAAASIVRDISLAVIARRRMDENGWLAAVSRTILGSRRRIGSLVVHFGIVMIAAGMIGSGLFQQTKTVSMRVSDSVTIAGFSLTLRELQNVEGQNFESRVARFSVSRDGRPLFEVAPEKRFYPIRAINTTEIAIESFLGGDLYLVMGDENTQGDLIVRVFWNPLVGWIWIGWFVVLTGAITSASETRRPARRAADPVVGKGNEVPAE